MRPAAERARDTAAGQEGHPPVSLVSLENATAAVPRRGRGMPRPLRILGTALSFAVYGTGALAIAFVVAPLHRSIAPTDAEAERRVQRSVHRAYRFFIGFMEQLGLFRTRWVGREALLAPGAKLVVASHPSLIDAPHLVAVLAQADCVVSEAWQDNLFLARTARAAGYLMSSDGPAMVAAAAERLRQGRTVLLFPEGTRTPADGHRRLRRGAAHVALAAGVPIVPVSIRCRPRMLMKGQRFWHVPDRTPEFTLRVLDPIDPRDVLSPTLPPSVAARRLTTLLSARLAESGA